MAIPESDRLVLEEIVNKAAQYNLLKGDCHKNEERFDKMLSYLKVDKNNVHYY